MRQFLALVNDSPALTKLANSSLYPLIYVVQQFIHWLFMAYSLVPFCLLTYDKWLKVGHSETPQDLSTMNASICELITKENAERLNRCSDQNTF